MKIAKIIVNAVVIFINFAVGYFIISGLYGYSVAYSAERKDKWLLVSLFWVVVLLVIDSFYFSVILYLRKKRKGLVIE